MPRSANISNTDALVDPVRGTFPRDGRLPDLDSVGGLFPPTSGDPAFDPEMIRREVGRLVTVPEVNTGHHFLDLSIKTGLAFIDATFKGDHPKYGVKHYGDERHDAFPPTIIAAVDALTSWGLHSRAIRLFRYWLANFVNKDGTIHYYGPALSEYGQLLHTGVLLHERAGTEGWWDEGRPALARMAGYLMGLCATAERNHDLIPGVPEADISSGDPNNLSDSAHSEYNRYFHNSAWIARGLTRWAELMEMTGDRESTCLRVAADRLAQRTLAAIKDSWPADQREWWCSPQIEKAPAPSSLTASTCASYTNYRYWPELLSSRLLPRKLANKLVDARITGGGQFCGMTRFQDHIDDWPLTDYLYGLASLGRKDDFLLSLYGHVAYHQAEGHLTAYEQVTLPPFKEMAPYCLPCQLVAARTASLLGHH